MRPIRQVNTTRYEYTRSKQTTKLYVYEAALIVMRQVVQRETLPSIGKLLN